MLRDQGKMASDDVSLSDNPFGNVSFDGAYDQLQLKASNTIGGRIAMQKKCNKHVWLLGKMVL